MTQPKPEPMLKMTAEDLSWIRRRRSFQQDAERGLDEAWLNILLRVEAGRQQAVFRIQHPMERCVERRDLWERSKDMARCNDPRHNWTPADWLAAVEQEVKGGE